MNKKLIAGFGFGVFIGLAAIWLREPKKAEPVDVPSAAESMPPFEATPISESVPVSSLPSKKEESPAAVQTKTHEEIFPTGRSVSAGFYAKHMTADFETYLQFMDVGVYSEIVNGRMAHEELLQHVKAQYELTDEELKQIIEAGRSALKSDRDFQAARMDEICKKGDSFRSVEELGAALNEVNKGFEANQEELGRKAMQQLEPVLAQKIKSKILNAPRREMMESDLAVIMSRRNHGLEVELGRVCSLGK